MEMEDINWIFVLKMYFFFSGQRQKETKTIVIPFVKKGFYTYCTITSAGFLAPTFNFSESYLNLIFW